MKKPELKTERRPFIRNKRGSYHLTKSGKIAATNLNGAVKYFTDLKKAVVFTKDDTVQPPNYEAIWRERRRQRAIRYGCPLWWINPSITAWC